MHQGPVVNIVEHRVWTLGTYLIINWVCRNVSNQLIQAYPTIPALEYFTYTSLLFLLPVLHHGIAEQLDALLLSSLNASKSAWKFLLKKWNDRRPEQALAPGDLEQDPMDSVMERLEDLLASEEPSSSAEEQIARNQALVGLMRDTKRYLKKYDEERRNQERPEDEQKHSPSAKKRARRRKR